MIKLFGYTYRYSNGITWCDVYQVFKTEKERAIWENPHIREEKLFEATLKENILGKEEVICLDFMFYKTYFYYDKKEEKAYKYNNIKKAWIEHNNYFAKRFYELINQ